MRLGHNLVAVLFPIITNYYLASMPSGVASLFHYAYRGVVAVYSISGWSLIQVVHGEDFSILGKRRPCKLRNRWEEIRKKRNVSLSAYDWFGVRSTPLFRGFCVYVSGLAGRKSFNSNEYFFWSRCGTPLFSMNRDMSECSSHQIVRKSSSGWM